MIWRTGRKVGRTIYRQRGPEPSDEDELVGMMDSPGLAEMVVRAANAASGDKSQPVTWQQLDKPRLVVQSCQVCGGVVPPEYRSVHEQWHNERRW